MRVLLTERLTEPSLSDSLNRSRVAHDRNKGTRERGMRNEGTGLLSHLAFATNRGALTPLALLPGNCHAGMRQATTGGGL